jgi:hypothetical protein
MSRFRLPVASHVDGVASRANAGAGESMTSPRLPSRVWVMNLDGPGCACHRGRRLPCTEPAGGGRFADVAERLEEIARTLRERSDELLGGNASDPLALLLAGYVMGYRARGGR